MPSWMPSWTRTRPIWKVRQSRSISARPTCWPSCPPATLTDCTLYVTLFPCNECAKVIIQSRLAHIYFMDEKNGDKPSIIASKRLLKMAGITFERYSPKSVVLQTNWTPSIWFNWSKIYENPIVKFRIRLINRVYWISSTFEHRKRISFESKKNAFEDHDKVWRMSCNQLIKSINFEIVWLSFWILTACVWPWSATWPFF